MKNGYYKIEEVGIQETSIFQIFISHDNFVERTKLCDGDLLERYIGDGLLIASSVGSTAHNLSYGGSVVFNTFTTLQITPIGPINSEVYRSLINSVIVPDRKRIEVVPSDKKCDLALTIDGETSFYEEVCSIKTVIGDKKIKCMRLRHYNFPQKINEKLLTD